MNEKELHAKAIRLIEGDIVQVNGHSVKLVRYKYIFDPCYCCELDCLCHKGNYICSVCELCDAITGDDCLLVLIG